MASTPVIRTSGSSFLGPDGEPLLLRGVCLGGWLNMENFITGYSGERVADARRGTRGRSATTGPSVSSSGSSPGSSTRPTPRSWPSSGFNLVRDRRRLQAPRGRRAAVRDQGGRLPPPGPGDRRARPARRSTRSSTCTRCPARRTSTGTPTIRPTSAGVLAAPALPGPGRAPLGGHRRALPRQPLGGGIQPAERTRRRVAARSSGRSTVASSTAIRAVDPDHIVFLDGNTYATEFDMFDEPFENAV